MRGPSFEQTWIPITQGCIVPSLFEIGPVVQEKIFFFISSMYFQICCSVQTEVVAGDPVSQLDITLLGHTMDTQWTFLKILTVLVFKHTKSV